MSHEGNSKVRLQLRGGTSFELPVSSNNIRRPFFSSVNIYKVSKFYPAENKCQERKF
jgi:hypothetical protein